MSPARLGVEKTEINRGRSVSVGNIFLLLTHAILLLRRLIVRRPELRAAKICISQIVYDSRAMFILFIFTTVDVLLWLCSSGLIPMNSASSDFLLSFARPGNCRPVGTRSDNQSQLLDMIFPGKYYITYVDWGVTAAVFLQSDSIVYFAAPAWILILKY